MIFKERMPAGLWDQGIVSTHRIGVGRKSFDLACLEKIGADISFQFRDMEPNSKNAYLHIITTGAGEFYAQNANTDFFNETYRNWVFPSPVNALQKSAALDGGLKKYHNPTYLEFGAVYEEHNNGRKGAQPKGEIVAAAYNDNMHRGELLVGVPMDKWAAELDALDRGEPLFWSMGSSVKEDICSYCGHRRRKITDSCEHLRFYKNAIDESGNVIFAINDAPHFHDISKVRKPADRIAFTLQKVASDEGPIYTDSDLFLPLSFVKSMRVGHLVSRRELLHKLAAMEKKMDAVCGGCRNMQCPVCGGGTVLNNLPKELDDEICDSCSSMPSDQLLRGLSDHKMMLGPKQFLKVIAKKDPESEDLEDMPEALSNVFSGMDSENIPEQELEDGSDIPTAKGRSTVDNAKIKDLAPMLSVEPEDVQTRVIRIVIMSGNRNQLPGKPEKKMRKKASELSPVSRYLAREYAKYQLGFLAEHPADGILSYCTAMNRM